MPHFISNQVNFSHSKITSIRHTPVGRAAVCPASGTFLNKCTTEDGALPARWKGSHATFRHAASHPLTVSQGSLRNGCKIYTDTRIYMWSNYIEGYQCNIRGGNDRLLNKNNIVSPSYAVTYMKFFCAFNTRKLSNYSTNSRELLQPYLWVGYET